ncbi:Rho GTPase-activating protein [Coemansia sp. RSA 1933]|nr:Rho GTPase-activating protein [Coemansia sp. RSA 1933]
MQSWSSTDTSTQRADAATVVSEGRPSYDATGQTHYASTGGISPVTTRSLQQQQQQLQLQQQQKNVPVQVDLTEIDGGLAMLLERSRHSLMSCKETVAFLKNRAKVEEDYSRSMQKLVQTTLKTMDHNKVGGGPLNTQQAAWQRLVEVHETLASNRMKFSITLNEMSEYLNNYVKSKESVRRKLKDTEQRYQKAIEETEVLLEKARSKYEVQSGEWERLLMKSGNSKTESGAPISSGGGMASASFSHGGSISGGGSSAPNSTNAISKTKNVGSAVSGIFSKHKGSTQESLERMGQEAGVKAKVANEAYKRLLNQTNAMRRDFYDVQLPKILASVMGLIEEVDQFLKFSLGKYAYTYESAVLADAITLKPIDAGGEGAALAPVGMVEMVGGIDTKTDLDNYLQITARSGGRINRSSIPYKEYEMSTRAKLYANPKPIFGVPLDVQLSRDKHPVPMILAKCADAVEAFGLQNEGIYRQSGQSSQVNKLRNEFDLDAEHVDLRSNAYVGDINTIASVLKMYLRELPGGLVPAAQRAAMLTLFPAGEPDNLPPEMTAYSHGDDELELAQKVSGLAEAIRNMPVPNRNTVAYLFAHLDKVQAFQEFNMMNSENLGIVFGPTIAPPGNNPAEAASDIRRSTKLVRFILDNRRAIFEAI